MARTSAGRKVSAWRKRLERHARSGLTVASFCAREKVSVPSFYAWRKKLAAGTASTPKTDRSRPVSMFRAVHVIPTTPALSLQFPSGIRVDVSTMEFETVRVVIAELARRGHSLPSEEGAC